MQLIEHNPKPGTLVLVDGVIEDQAAVSHQELMVALDKGWQVWGLADMGAIRAFELAQVGMKGFGTVYEALQNQPDITDDQVLWHKGSSNDEQPQDSDNPAICKLHCAQLLLRLQHQKRLSCQQYQHLLSAVRHIHYRDLNLAQLLKLLQRQSELSLAELKEQLSHCDMKTQDLNHFLCSRIWLGADNRRQMPLHHAMS